MDDINAELASLRTEVRYLKIIIPSACALVALLFAVFWGVERKNIGKRVTEALNEHAVSEAIDSVNASRDESESTTQEIINLKNTSAQTAESLLADIVNTKNNLPWTNVGVLSVDHITGKTGQYFNFEAKEVDAALGNSSWGNKKAVIIDTKNQKIGTVTLWRKKNGGTKGSAHGRWDVGSAENQWVPGQQFILISGHTE